jgi:hypothetical protein
MDLSSLILEKEKSSVTPVRTFDIDSQSGHLDKAYDINCLIEYLNTILQTRYSGLIGIY